MLKLAVKRRSIKANRIQKNILFTKARALKNIVITKAVIAFRIYSNNAYYGFFMFFFG